MKLRNICLIFLLLGLGIAAPASADDTEIYIDPDYYGADPLLMFHLEYSPELASTIDGCTNVTATDATTLATECPSLAALGGYFIASDVADNKITRIELLRAVLKRVLLPLKDIEVGFMMDHAQADLGNCGNNSNGCSNGGYILKKFTSLEAPPDSFHENDPTSTDWSNLASASPQKYAFFQMLNALAEPQGNLSHPNQNKETYFELYRYLEGFHRLNADNGWSDFGTDATEPLGVEADCTSQGREVATVPCPLAIDPTTPTPTPPDGTGTRYLGPDPLAFYFQGANRTTLYHSPLDTDCQKVFVINIVDGSGLNNNDADTAIAQTYANEGMNLTVRNGDDGFVDVVRWLHDVDLADGTIHVSDLTGKQNVTSFFIAMQPQQVNDAAVAGGTNGAYDLDVSPNTVVYQLKRMLQEIQSVSTTFVSAAIPVNVFNRSEVLDNVFIALFQTDDAGKPFWTGNLKKLKLNIINNQIKLRSVNLTDAIGNDGRILPNALTYWTNSNGYDVRLDVNANDGEVNTADGRSVNRGGAGQIIPGFLDGSGNQGTVQWTNTCAAGTTCRKLFTEDNNALIPLEFSNMDVIWPYLAQSDWSEAINSTFTGTWSSDYSNSYSPGCYTYFATTTTTQSSTRKRNCTVGDEASNIMAYIRGFDTTASNTLGATSLGSLVPSRDMSRRWLFGDPLHSRPLPINYGAHAGHSMSNPDIRIFAGANDGFFRMFENTTANGTDSGKEGWAFMPKETLKIQKTLMLNQGDPNYFHPYGVDGAPVAYMNDANHNGTIENGEQVYIFFGMRRGGHSYYALNISDPDNPSFMWKITNTGDFSELGLTFSNPTVAQLDWGQGKRPVLVFGGGYDTNKDTHSLGTNDNEGNAIYVVDAQTGQLVWKASGSATGASVYHVDAMVDSIPSAVTVVDTTGDGIADRAYVGDTGGVVWRVDFYSTSVGSWHVSKLLDAGRHNGGGTQADDRRFFYPPDFVPARDSTGPFDGVVIGSGNRAHPQGTSTVDWVYMIKDRRISTLDPSAATSPYPMLQNDGGDTTKALADVTSDCLQMDPNNCSIDLSNGWKLQLEETGEKSLASALTLTGAVYFNTYIPVISNAQCGPTEGNGLQYIVALQDATAVYNRNTSSGGQDSDGNATDLGKVDRTGGEYLKTPGIPSENVYISYRDPNTNKKITCTMAPDFTCLESGRNAGWRTFWYKKEE